MAATLEKPKIELRSLRLHGRLRECIESMASEGYPNETCGLLIGRPNGCVAEVVDLVQARNLNRERAHDRYELDPGDFMAADSAARRRGMEIVGIWHSHPDHPARPSATDRAGAWEGWSYLIVSVGREGVDELRSWHLDRGNFLEEEIEWWIP